MKLLLPIASSIGPVYFALQEASIICVLLWAALWNSLRWLAGWRTALNIALEPSDQPASWLETHLAVYMALAFVTSLAAFMFIHVTAYVIVRHII